MKSPDPRSPTAANPSTEVADVVLIGFPPEQADSLIRGLGEIGLEAKAYGPADSSLISSRADIAMLGPELVGKAALRVTEQLAEHGSRCVITAAGDDLELFADLLEGDHLLYLSRRPPSTDDLVALAAGRPKPDRSPSSWAPSEESRLLFATDLALETARALSAETDLSRAGGAVEAAAAELVVADRAYCLAYDPDQDVLFGRDEGGQRWDSAASGLLGWVVRSGKSVRIDGLHRDPRFDPELDDARGQAGGPGPGPFLAVPIRAAHGPVLAVLATLRFESGAVFSERDRRVLEALAAEVYRPFEQLHRETTLRRVLEQALPGVDGLRSGAAELFRPEALEEHTRGDRTSGEVLRLMPAWTRAAYVLLVVAVLALALAASVVRVDRWVSGPAIVLDRGPVLNQKPGSTAPTSIAALFPGRERSRLRVGQMLRLSLSDGTSLELPIETLSPRLLGPAAVQDELGPTLKDALGPLNGTVAWVEANIDGPAGELYPGWIGRAEVRVGSQRVLETLWQGGGDE